MVSNAEALITRLKQNPGTRQQYFSLKTWNRAGRLARQDEKAVGLLETIKKKLEASTVYETHY